MGVALLGGCGRILGGGVCPDHIARGGVSLEVDQYVAAHPREALRMSTCVSDVRARCDAAGGMSEPVELSSPLPGPFFFPDVSAGPLWVRVIIIGRGGAVLVDSHLRVREHHAPGVEGCPGTGTTSAGVAVTATGDLKPMS